jgi:hypothetical protein
MELPVAARDSFHWRPVLQSFLKELVAKIEMFVASYNKKTAPFHMDCNC